jgi:hypothetical protein
MTLALFLAFVFGCALVSLALLTALFRVLGLED